MKNKLEMFRCFSVSSAWMPWLIYQKGTYLPVGFLVLPAPCSNINIQPHSERSFEEVPYFSGS